MRVRIEQLECLCVLEKPVMLNTGNPLIDKGVVIEGKHIEILKKFKIEEVEVTNFLAGGKKFEPKQLKHSDLSPYWELEIESMFKQVILNYKEVFMVVQSNGVPNLKKIYRSIEEFFRLVVKSKKGVALLLYRICDKDDYIYHYAVCTAILAGYLSYQSKYSMEEAIKICKAGLLSNIGLSKVNIGIIRNKKTFSKDDIKEWNKHILHGYQIVSGLPEMNLFTKNIVIQHEELLDGSGFPLKLRADKICMGARFVGISEIYYRYMCPNYFFSKKTPFEIIYDMKKKEMPKYDQSIVEILAQCFCDAFVGAPVRLSNKEVGYITGIKNGLDVIVTLDETNEEVYVKGMDKVKVKIESIL